MQILLRPAVLVACLDLAVGQTISPYVLVQRATSWFKAREFCQTHYVDLAVLSTEEQYFTLRNATDANKVSFWLGLQRQSALSDWKWVDGEELSYEHWYRRNYGVRCASLEAMLKKNKKLLARYCEEQHMAVCQGPVSPQPVTVDSAGADHVTLSWNVSAFMQMTPHRYNVTTCADTCDTFLFPYTHGSASMNVIISNLTSATEYFVEISALVVRPDGVTGRNTTHQSNATALQVKTVDSVGLHEPIIVRLKLFMSLAPPLWILYCVLVSLYFKGSNHDVSPVELSTVDNCPILQTTSDHRNHLEGENI